MILVEKYRPDSFSSEYLVKTKPIIELEERLKNNREFPHLLFSGEPGTGKTTIAHIIVKELSGSPDARFQELCLDLNASDSRKIEHVRGVIKEYAKVRSLYTDKKFIFLDEVDAMTKDAQHALRRIMEDYSHNCMFILSCNYPSKLIQPLKSRCSHYEFPKALSEEIYPIVRKICKEENINIEDAAITEVIKQCNNDIREVINWLDGHSGNLSISVEDIRIEDNSTELMKIIESKNLDGLQELILQSEPRELVQQMLPKLKRDDIEAVTKLAETHYRILSMSQTDGQLQLYSFCLWLMYREDVINLGKVDKLNFTIDSDVEGKVTRPRWGTEGPRATTKPKEEKKKKDNFDGWDI